MLSTLTNTTANREIEGTVDKFFKLANVQSCDRFIDPFCGAGSLSICSMQTNLAKSYFMNDAYHPAISLLQAVNSYPQQLIHAYHTLTNRINASKNFSSSKSHFYGLLIEELTKQTTESLKQAAIWLFLANHLELNRPVFNGSKLISSFDTNKAPISFEPEKKINTLHELFTNNTVNFYSEDAESFLSKISDLNEKDMVILDPPYPGYYDPQKSIFFRPEADDQLFHKLSSMLYTLNKKDVKFIFNYDLFFGKEKPWAQKYFVDSEIFKLQHYILVSHNPHDTEFDTLFEHVYVSQNIIIDDDALPEGLYPYTTFQELNYQEAKNLVANLNTGYKPYLHCLN